MNVRFFTDNFGECGRPRVSWQIDPFGHSREQANIFAKMGFDGLFFGRLDYADKEKRMEERTMEMIWRGEDQDTTGDSNLFTGALFHAYSPPPGFCFDSLCTDVIMDDPRLEDYNFEAKISEFINYTKLQADSYATSNLIMTMGEDFNYANANMWFKNMDKLRNFFNKNHEKYGINILYSTPSCYLKSLNDDKNMKWPMKTDDFFPYASDPHAYWTGYFTSRPALKGMIRAANSQLQACKQIHVLHEGEVDDDRLEMAKRAVAVNQHHDAVTGTAKQHVTDDYGLRLHNGMEACGQLIMETISNVSRCQMTSMCPLLNISQCDFTEKNSKYSVTLYNPLSTGVKTPVRLPVPACDSYQVSDDVGSILESQLVPLPQEVLSIPGRDSQATCELVFMVNLPPLGFKTVKVSRGGETVRIKANKIQALTLLENANLKLVSSKNGKLIKLHNKMAEVHLSQDFAFYRGAVGNNSRFIDRASGAYIFRPLNQEPQLVGDPLSASIIRGPVVQEVHQRYNDWTSQVIRLYKDQEVVEFEWIVGPLPLDEAGAPGHEVITRYSTDIESGKSFK